MRFPATALSRALFATVGLCVIVHANAQAQTPQRPAESQTEQLLAASAQEGRFTFVVFYKANDESTQKMVESIEKGIAAKASDAKIAFVHVVNPAEKTLIDKLGVGRAPMPLCIAIAPTGAVTGVFRKVVSAQDIDKAFVTPAMTVCMKAMQDGKIVLVCVQDSPRALTPQAVKDFQVDPRFKNRVATVPLDTRNPAEFDFLSQLQIDVSNKDRVATVMLAPPGVLVGKYTADASIEKMAAELHAAGKCCDDPNCKHQKP